MPPWEYTGEHITQWRRQVWKQRRLFYMSEYNDKVRREQDAQKLRLLKNG